MTCNIGKTDRALRVAFGIILIVVGVVIAGTQGMTLGIIGLIPLGTGLVGNCPAYSLFGINNCKPSKL
ncbi:MAG: DUF2892 domain-containing protein [Nitrospina sp.]|nr:DUF2892 domain-containing protein [Nitrospina sp.]